MKLIIFFKIETSTTSITTTTTATTITTTTTTCRKIEEQGCSGDYIDLIVEDLDGRTAESCENACLEEEECKYFIHKPNVKGGICELLRVVI